MNTFVDIKDLAQHDGKEVNLRGWLHGKRSGGKILFLLLRDGTGMCQCVVEAATPEAYAAAGSLTQECSLELSGTARIDPRAPGGCEISVTTAKQLNPAVDYPVTRKAHGVDFLMEHRHLWLRSQRQTTILRIRHTIIQAARAFFDDNGFTLIDTPILSPGAAEGAGTLFPVDYFGEKVFLAQTGQLYLEAACMALGKVYCFGPTFRAEKSKTRRHLTEFWMIEPEIAFAELPDLAECAENFLCSIVSRVLQSHREDLAFLGRDITPLEKITPPFPRITYSEAVDILHSDAVRQRLEADLTRSREELQTAVNALAELEEKRAKARKGWQEEKLDEQIHQQRDTIHELETRVRNLPQHMNDAQAFQWGRDLGGDEETILSSEFDRPLIITEYPRAAKAFYMKLSPADPRVVLNMDVLAPEGYGEIIGGSQREDDIAAIERRMAEESMDPAPYQWYLDLRRYGSVSHGGFGLGIERTVSWICGLRHIRETIPFPRLMGRVYP